jgi:hypothetical protein
MFNYSACVDMERFLVTCMMDLDKSSLNGCDLGKQDDFFGGLHGSYIVVSTNT